MDLRGESRGLRMKHPGSDELAERAMNQPDGGVVHRFAAEEGDDHLHPQILLLPSSYPSSSAITVSAPAAWLSRIPYFATRLTEPWIDSTFPQQHITLQCAPGSTPEHYLECLYLLSLSPRSWPSRFQSVGEVLQILPVADHLLFQKCWDACMGFLASSPWSTDEEHAIRATISELNMKISSDVMERLDTSHDGAVLEALLYEAISTPSLESCFEVCCKMWLTHSSAPIGETLSAILLKLVMGSFIPKDGKPLPREWYVLAKCLLKFTDAQQFILALVNSEDLLIALSSCLRQSKGDAFVIFSMVLQKVEQRAVFLSNVQRSRLVKWSAYANEVPDYNRMRLRLAETLPFNDAARMGVLKTNSFHNAVRPCIEHILHRVSHMDKAGLKAVLGEFPCVDG